MGCLLIRSIAQVAHTGERHLRPPSSCARKEPVSEDVPTAKNATHTRFGFTGVRRTDSPCVLVSAGFLKHWVHHGKQSGPGVHWSPPTWLTTGASASGSVHTGLRCLVTALRGETPREGKVRPSVTARYCVVMTLPSLLLKPDKCLHIPYCAHQREAVHPIRRYTHVEDAPRQNPQVTLSLSSLVLLFGMAAPLVG